MKPLASCANKRISATKMWSSKKLSMGIDIEFSVAVCSLSFIRSCHNSSSPLSQLFSSYICWELDSEMWSLLLQMWANPAAWLTWASQLQSNTCSINTHPAGKSPQTLPLLVTFHFTLLWALLEVVAITHLVTWFQASSAGLKQEFKLNAACEEQVQLIVSILLSRFTCDRSYFRC